MKIGIIAAMEQELVLLVEQLENKVEEICFRQYSTIQDVWANMMLFWCNQA